MQAKKMSKIIECDARQCLYNDNGSCSTFAITVGSEEPCCETFMQPIGTARGGIRGVTGGVGACHMADCAFNTQFECSAPGINVTSAKSSHPDCGTYQAR